MNQDKLQAALNAARTKYNSGWRPQRLLSDGNTKLRKRPGHVDEKWFLTGLSLAPANSSGYEMCPQRSVECTNFCLFASGMAQEDFHSRGLDHNPAWSARILKTLWYMEDRGSFLRRLVGEIANLVRRHDRVGIRLNVFSDRPWERQPIIVDEKTARRHKIEPGFYSNLMQLFPTVQFYDYTKIEKRMFEVMPINYHLVYSLTEDNLVNALRVLGAGGSVAVVTKDPIETFHGYRVIDGDEHDFRFLDPENCVVRLKPKGPLLRSNSPFIYKEAA